MKASIRFVITGANQYVEFEGTIKQGSQPMLTEEEMATFLLQQEMEINKGKVRVHIFLK